MEMEKKWPSEAREEPGEGGPKGRREFEEGG